ncbi:MAG TPA: YeeE/YedE family protein [Kofleriaceae bacterium]|nr:YeeE/YedE family protein [Kofleriaceae bacterium]
MGSFTPLPSLLGGMIIGLAVSAMLLLLGRIAGISGIVGGMITSRPGDRGWRLLFFAGMVGGGVILAQLRPESFVNALPRSAPVLVIAGMLVGFGSRLGNGCTSGHGVCGISRLSRRSIVATGVFMAVAALVVLATRQLAGGVL